jgi:hypothetical protein
MDSKSNKELEPGSSIQSSNTTPRVLEKLFDCVVPDGPTTGKSIARNLWKQHPSLIGVIPRIPMVLAPTIYGGARDAFYWRMVIMQACTLLLGFIDVMSPALLLNLSVTFAAMLTREAYVHPKDRLRWELVTVFMAPFLVVTSAIVLGLLFPRMMLPPEVVVPRAFKMAIPIAIFRYKYAPEAGPENPYKNLLRLNHKVWFFSYTWIACVVGYLLSLDQAAPPISRLQTFITVNSAVLLFTSGIRLQLNPLDGTHRHRVIDIRSLFEDPFQQDIKLIRAYLFTGADWFRNFNVQSLSEILAFLLLLSPLAVALWQWNTGHPNAANINWRELGADGAAWIGLVVTWPYVKRMNREVAVPFDEAIAAF